MHTVPVVAAVLVGSLAASQPANAKGPCGKSGSRCRLIQGVRVLDITSHGAVVDASLNEEATYEIVLQRRTCPTRTCERPSREVVATGTLTWGLGKETVSVELGHLEEDAGYDVMVLATSASRKEQLRRPARFTTS